MHILTNFVVALPSEARPIIGRLDLKRCEQARGVTLYRREDFRLAVSGIGKAASAAAVGYIAGGEPSATRHIWLNVGIAGHATLAKGTAGIAHRITDQATGTSYCPSIAFRTPCQTYALVCHDKPTTSYAQDAMCDMESSAFFSAASRFSSVDFVQALKIVSDNSAADIRALDRRAISRLVEMNLDIIEAVVGSLREIAARDPVPSG
jgi:adenosylhomocysteine nucleosidase